MNYIEKFRKLDPDTKSRFLKIGAATLFALGGAETYVAFQDYGNASPVINAVFGMQSLLAFYVSGMSYTVAKEYDLLNKN